MVMEPIEPWGDDEIEITRDLFLSCEEMTVDDEYCIWSGRLTLDGFEYMGIEYFQWACPVCKTDHVEEDTVR